MSLLLETAPAWRRKSSRHFVQRPVLVACFFAAAYLVTWAGHLDCGDSSYRIAWAKSMLFHQTARIDDAGLAQTQPGPQYSKYAIGHSLLAMPFLAAAEALKRVAHVHAEGPVYMLLFILNAAIFLGMVAHYFDLRRFGPTESRRTLLMLGFCTVWLAWSRMDSIEQLVTTFLFAGFLLAKHGRPALGILLAGFAINIRPDSIVPVGLLAIWCFWSDRRLSVGIRLALAFLPALAINATANWVRWHTILEAGYTGEHFSEPFLLGLYGLLFSSGKSIFLYSPPLILGIFVLVRHARRRTTPSDYWFFASVLISEIILYSAWWDWSGDDCWGVRFLTPGTMLMCIPAVELLHSRRWPKPAAALALAGLAVQSLAVIVDPMASEYVIRNYRLPRVSLYPGQPIGAPNRIDLEDLRFNPRYSPLATNWLMLRVLIGHPPAVEINEKEIDRTGTPLYNSLLAAGWNPANVECDLFWARLLKVRLRGTH